MKLRNLLVVAALGFFAACETPSRVTDDTVVVVAPDGIQTAFTTQYPSATTVVWSHYDPVVIAPIDWELAGWSPMDENDYIVTFTMDGDEYYAWYDDTGTWIGTAYVVRDFTSMPAGITNMISSKYPGYTISTVNKELQKDRVAYEVELKNADTKLKLLVDADGNIIKQKSKALY